MESRPNSQPKDLNSQRRAQELFEQVLDLPGEERMEWLRSECNDERVLQEVVELLALTDASDKFLETEHAVESFHAIESIPPGERIGPFEVVRELGRGGMGVVLLARRADGQFDQEVALKVLRRGMDSAFIHGSFLRERQILAWLQHSHIARLYDGGITEDGRPWFALEYVQGRPITDYCEAMGVHLRTRVELVIQACQAIAHAHRSLVIHRDLKPSNVLVTDEGKVKLLDFGIAEVLAESASAHAGASSDARAMTPAYAAPEQLNQQAVTTATDIHALGILLFELLTGERPRRYPTGSPATMVDHPHPGSVELPSRVARNAQARRFLHGDLDAVLLKAIHQDPERRYGTADGFAVDLRRFLEGHPVSARRATLAYQAARFARRNLRTLVLIGTIVLVTVGAGIVTSIQGRHAQRERARTQSVKDFLVSLVDSANPNAEGGAALRDEAILEVALERAEAELLGEPEMQAELFEVIGHAYIARGDLTRADGPLTSALELRRAAHSEPHPALADALYGMAALRRREKRFDEARRYYEEALDVRIALHGPDDLQVAVLLNGLGANAYGAGELDEAERYYRQSLELKERQLDEDHPEVGTGRHNLALLLMKKGAYEEAEPMIRGALEAAKKNHGLNHPTTSLSHGALGRILHGMGRYDEAEQEYFRARQIRLEAYGTDHPQTRSIDLSLAMVSYDAGDLDEAEQRFRSRLETLRHDLGEANSEYVSAFCDLAELLVARGRLDEAEATLTEIRALLSGMETSSDGSATNVLATEGAVELKRGRLPEALESLSRACEQFEAEELSDTRAALRARIRLGDCLSRLGRYDEAEVAVQPVRPELEGRLMFTREARLARDFLSEHRLRSRGDAGLDAQD